MSSSEACEEISLRLKGDAVKLLNRQKADFRKRSQRLATQRKAYRERMRKNIMVRPSEWLPVSAIFLTMVKKTGDIDSYE